MNGTVAVILAGGEARRLGGIDKTLIPLGGTPILSRIVDRLQPQVERLALSASGDPNRFGIRLPVLADRDPGIGPLAGLMAALDWAAELDAEALLTVPGDTPFIPSDLVRALSPAPAVAVSDGRRHHLVALWPVSWRGALRSHLDQLDPSQGRRAFGVRAFADRFGIREVSFAIGGGDPFFNVNTPDERLAAEARVATLPSDSWK